MYINNNKIEQTQILAHVSFNNQKPGEKYDLIDVAKDFGTIKSLGTMIPNSRVRVVKRDDKDGNAIKVKYPRGALRSLNSGASWFWSNIGKHKDLYLSYWIKFPDDFDFRAGGKLHGLCGGKCNTGGKKPNGHDGWSSRIHWGKDGRITQYIYHKDQAGDYGQTIFWMQKPDAMLFDSDKLPNAYNERVIRIFRGKWHYIMTRVTVNDIGQRNGFVQSWFDGDLVLNIHGFEFRDTSCKEDELLIDKMYFSTFFGGNDASYKPEKNEYAFFDDFRITKGLFRPPELACERIENRLILRPPQPKLFDTQVPGLNGKYGYGMHLEWVTPADLSPKYYEIQYTTDASPSEANWITYQHRRKAHYGSWINHHGNIHFGDYILCLPSRQTFYYRIRALDEFDQPITLWSNIESGTIAQYHDTNNKTELPLLELFEKI